MTANFGFPYQQPVQTQATPVQQPQAVAYNQMPVQGFVPQQQQGFVQPQMVQPSQTPPMANQTAFQKPKGPNIWYRPLSQKDYPNLQQIGSVSIIVRFLPGFNQNGLYEAIFEKNTAGSKYPNSQRWVVPVLVISDPLHPQYNGFVGIMEISKTLYQRIKSKNTPANYFDFNTGHNFHINISLEQSKDGTQLFPNYKKSGFEAQPTQCNAQYVAPKMQAGKFSDFATFVNMLNNPKPQAQQGFVPPPPVNQAPVQGFVPQQIVQQPQVQPGFAPQQFQQQQVVQQDVNAGSEQEFNEIFNQQ